MRNGRGFRSGERTGGGDAGLAGLVCFCFSRLTGVKVRVMRSCFLWPLDCAWYSCTISEIVASLVSSYRTRISSGMRKSWRGSQLSVGGSVEATSGVWACGRLCFWRRKKAQSK